MYALSLISTSNFKLSVAPYSSMALLSEAMIFKELGFSSECYSCLLLFCFYYLKALLID